MSQQLPLFPAREPAWIAVLWHALGPARRAEIGALLAEIGRRALAGGPRVTPPRQETAHDV